ncbi:MAG: hypothetical protein AAFX46_09205 [Cyanobacteria bacterium J06636_27]
MRKIEVNPGLRLFVEWLENRGVFMKKVDSKPRPQSYVDWLEMPEIKDWVKRMLGKHGTKCLLPRLIEFTNAQPEYTTSLLVVSDEKRKYRDIYLGYRMDIGVLVCFRNWDEDKWKECPFTFELFRFTQIDSN